MSAGNRIPLAWGRGAGAALMSMWGMAEPSCLLVGSARRGRETVGDLEFVAPLPEDKRQDPLFDAMDRTMETTGLWGAHTVPVAKPLKGFRRGFIVCDVGVQLVVDGQHHVETVATIERYTAANRGWKTIMRTGPTDFGRWFLVKWKERWQIPQARQASVDGHLVDTFGKVVPAWSEEECFDKCGLRWVAPEQRDEVARRCFAGGRSSRA